MSYENQINFHQTSKNVLEFFTYDDVNTYVANCNGKNLFGGIREQGVKGVSTVIEKGYYHETFEKELNDKIERFSSESIENALSGKALDQNDVDILSNTLYLTYVRTLLTYDNTILNDFTKIYEEYKATEIKDKKKFKHSVDAIVYQHDSVIDMIFKDSYLVLSRPVEGKYFISGSDPILIGNNSEFLENRNYRMVLTPTLAVTLRRKGSRDNVIPYGDEKISANDVDGLNRWIILRNQKIAETCKHNIHVFSHNKEILNEAIKNYKSYYKENRELINIL